MTITIVHKFGNASKHVQFKEIMVTLLNARVMLDGCVIVKYYTHREKCESLKRWILSVICTFEMCHNYTVTANVSQWGKK